VKRLLERESVNINFKDKDGRTPLSWAAQNGYSDVVELLLENEDIDIDSKDKDRRTPLW
jgi:ankyrin repeat protein